MRVWRTADGTSVGEALTGHDGAVFAVAAEALPDGTPVIISGGEDGTVRVWRTADGIPLVPPLDLPESVRTVAVHGNVIAAAGQTSRSTSQRSHGSCAGYCSVSRNNDLPVKRPDNGRLSGTSADASKAHCVQRPHVDPLARPHAWCRQRRLH